MTEAQQSFATFLKTNLNEAQQQAVAHTKGSLLVVAGAGSGKTRVITARITHLIVQEKVLPGSIVALTFTNKAAKEMQERVASFLHSTRDLPFIGTFHAYCLRILKNNSALLPNPFISILDSDDQHKMLAGIIARHQLSKQISTQQVASYISQTKNQTVDPDLIPGGTYGQHPLMRELHAAYEQEKRNSKCLDFDDLLLETLRLFKRNPLFKAAFQERIRHILVDEYQDTNVIQHELLQCMAQHENTTTVDSICVVGDEDQSIYSWRGATVANILNFKKDFGPTTVIKLEQNYRSIQSILDIANHVIQHNHNRTPKQLWSDFHAENRIVQLMCLSDYQEGESIAALLKEIEQSQKLSDTAILYRTHFQSRAIEETLIRHAIPYTIIGGVQFYERKEIKDLLAYMRLIVNPFDRTSFMRVVNCPARSLGEKFEELFFNRWQEEPFLTFSQLAKKLMDEGAIVGAKRSSLLNFIAIFDNCTADAAPTTVLDHLIGATGYFAYIKKSYTEEEAQERIENIKELARSIAHIHERQPTTVALFLDEVALMQEHRLNKNKSSDPVLLMTLHAAKGLEFNTVILAGLEEGLLPSSRSVVDTDKLEEERRLFYVGITRARERLVLTHSRYRYTYGAMSDQVRSRFLDEIPKTMVPIHDLSRSQPAQVKQFFAQWLKGDSKQDASPEIVTFGPSKQTTRKTVGQKATSSSRPAASHEADGWKKNQPVTHPTFGVGIIKNVERRENGNLIIEVTFKTGDKKIAHSFLKTL
jgi:DNA helicase-2/ATP-dependent DNA helicase PcrA